MPHLSSYRIIYKAEKKKVLELLRKGEGSFIGASRVTVRPIDPGQKTPRTNLPQLILASPILKDAEVVQLVMQRGSLPATTVCVLKINDKTVAVWRNGNNISDYNLGVMDLDTGEVHFRQNSSWAVILVELMMGDPFVQLGRNIGKRNQEYVERLLKA